MAKLKTKLPDGDGRNGIGAIASQLVDTPSEKQIIVAVVHTAMLHTNCETGQIEPIMEIDHIEPVFPEDRHAVVALLEATLAKRMPADLGPDMSPAKYVGQLFGRVPISTMEDAHGSE